jgi:hypothetical protein
MSSPTRSHVAPTLRGGSMIDPRHELTSQTHIVIRVIAPTSLPQRHPETQARDRRISAADVKGQCKKQMS